VSTGRVEVPTAAQLRCRSAHPSWVAGPAHKWPRGRSSRIRAQRAEPLRQILRAAELAGGGEPGAATTAFEDDAGHPLRLAFGRAGQLRACVRQVDAVRVGGREPLDSRRALAEKVMTAASRTTCAGSSGGTVLSAYRAAPLAVCWAATPQCCRPGCLRARLPGPATALGRFSQSKHVTRRDR
jgi:hypothetical protein